MPRILIVEDKDSLRAMLEEMLKAEGLQVVSISSGSAAVERLRGGERVDLVLTDWRLPGADGLAVLDAAIAQDPTLPVLVMTAFGSIETAVEAMKHGAEDFITKPVDPDLLRLLVSRAIERRAVFLARVVGDLDPGHAGGLGLLVLVIAGHRLG